MIRLLNLAITLGGLAAFALLFATILADYLGALGTICIKTGTGYC